MMRVNFFHRNLFNKQTKQAIKNEFTEDKFPPRL